MAAYVKNGDQIVLAFSKGEAIALLGLVHKALDECADEMERPKNHSTAEAEARAVRALETACEPSSRSGAAIP